MAELLDPAAAAKSAGLRYVSDNEPGFRRVRHGKGFKYVAADGRRVSDNGELCRLRSLAIPPAYSDVWICRDPNGHLQATSRDSRGRKQYRYHSQWREVRDETKFERLLEFAAALPTIRTSVGRDLRLAGLPKAKVLATVVRLLDTTLIRVGNEEYARANRSFGLTTLRSKHAAVTGKHLRLRFRGKGGKEHDVDIHSERLARIVRQCQQLPGQELFQYVDDAGEARRVDSLDVNEYLREISGGAFTAKDFRTWHASVECFRALAERPPVQSATAAKSHLEDVIKHVAARLRNTPAICRKCYIHPAVIDAHLAGIYKPRLPARPQRRGSLWPVERSMVRFLKAQASGRPDGALAA